MQSIIHTLMMAMLAIAIAIHDNANVCGTSQNIDVAWQSAYVLAVTGDYDGRLAICGIEEDHPIVARLLALREP